MLGALARAGHVKAHTPLIKVITVAGPNRAGLIWSWPANAVIKGPEDWNEKTIAHDSPVACLLLRLT